MRVSFCAGGTICPSSNLRNWSMESSICRHPVISTAEPRHALDCWPASTPTAHRCQAACNVTCHMLDSIPQPDVFLRIDPSYGWQSRDQGEYPAGAPELI